MGSEKQFSVGINLSISNLLFDLSPSSNLAPLSVACPYDGLSLVIERLGRISISKQNKNSKKEVQRWFNSLMEVSNKM
ncbi:23885_t:CDS:2 [Gigaspora rosea]|nr:23885_t:CDS:2 [Gigaspora rosea]